LVLSFDAILQAASESLTLKQTIFKSLAAEIQPSAILATNTSSISITKIAASVIPEGQSASSEDAKAAAGRVVGTSSCETRSFQVRELFLGFALGLHFFNPVPVMVSVTDRLPSRIYVI